MQFTSVGNYFSGCTNEWGKKTLCSQRRCGLGLRLLLSGALSGKGVGLITAFFTHRCFAFRMIHTRIAAETEKWGMSPRGDFVFLFCLHI